MLVEPTMEYEGVRGLTGHWRAVTTLFSSPRSRYAWREPICQRWSLVMYVYNDLRVKTIVGIAIGLGGFVRALLRV